MTGCGADAISTAVRAGLASGKAWSRAHSAGAGGKAGSRARAMGAALPQGAMATVSIETGLRTGRAFSQSKTALTFAALPKLVRIANPTWSLEITPDLRQLRPKSPTLGRIESGPRLTNIGPASARIAQICSHLCQVLPISGEIRPSSPRVGQIWAAFGQHRSPLRSNLAMSGSALAKPGPTLANIGSNWAKSLNFG